MQYPIIDNLILAYLANGWTGLDIPETITFTPNQLGSGTPSPDNIRPIEGTYIPSYGTVYGGTLDVTTGVLSVDMKYDQMTYSYLSSLSSSYIDFSKWFSQVGGNSVWVRNWNYLDYPETIQGGIKANCNAFPISMHNSNIFAAQYRTYFGIGTMTSVDEFLSVVQALENQGDGLWIAHELKTPIAYQCTDEDINYLLTKYSSSILKLPMIKYFPHAVIDALISASTGQQTAEATEILKHYLTPLGIGGI